MSANQKSEEKLVAHYVMYKHDFILEESIDSVYPFVDKILIARTLTPWNGKRNDLKETDEVLKKISETYSDKIEIYADSFSDEQTQRNFLINISKARGHKGAFIVDCDEIFSGESFTKIYDFIKKNNPAALRIPYLTFIKDASFTVASPYESGLFYVSISDDIEFTNARQINTEEMEMPYPEPEILHFSYIRKKDSDILEKVRSFMHSHDTDWDKWYEEVYLNFSPSLKNFHPVWPTMWSAVQGFDSKRFPQKLYDKFIKNKKLIFDIYIKNQKEIKLHLGCGNKILDGFINIDLFNETADIRMNISSMKYFEDNSVDEIFMNAVFEHLYTFEQKSSLSEWFRILKPGGVLRIDSIPDFDRVIMAYMNKKPGNMSRLFDLYEVSRYTHGAYEDYNRIGQIHKDIFTIEKVRALIEGAGFGVDAITDVCWEDEPNPVNINVRASKPVAINANKNPKKSNTNIDPDRKYALPDAVEKTFSHDKPVCCSIIIPVYNKIEYTRKCLKSLYETTGSMGCEIIVIDNGSTDGTKEFLNRLKHTHKNLIVIENDENLGFAKANNIGAGVASGEYIVFLNNDTEALSGWLEAGINKLEQDKMIGIVGAKLLYPDRTIQHCGINFVRSYGKKIPIWPTHRFRGVNENYPGVLETKELLAVTGACMFIRKKLFLELQGFDEDYGMYFEDIDLCFKAIRQNKLVVYEPNCTLIHHEGKSGINRAEIDRQNEEASKIFYSKWSVQINNLLKTGLEREIYWIAPFFNPSGYASEAINFALGLDKYIYLTIRNQNPLVSDEFIANIPDHWKETLLRQHRVSPHKWPNDFSYLSNSIFIHHQPGNNLTRFRNSAYCIGRTMFETDRIPKNWVIKCNQMDEIWVPSKFNLNTFANAGVDKEKIFVIPESIDTEIFDPNKIEGMDLPGKEAFKFLSVFEWTNRKGWDVLLNAYFKAFTNKDNVCLYLRTYLLSHYDIDTKEFIQNKIDLLIDKEGYNKEKLPRYELLTKQLPFNEILRLYKSVDAFVLSSRGEGWGRPYMEAMAMGLPVVGTNWSGNTEFMTHENSYLIDVETLADVQQNEIESYLGHKWAHPSEEHLIKILTEIYSDPETARRKGLKARNDIIKNFNLDAVARLVVDRINEIEKVIKHNKSIRISPPDFSSKKNISMIWEGPQFVNHSLALVNRELCSLAAKSDLNLSIVKTEPDQFKPARGNRFYDLLKNENCEIDKVDIHVRHQWPPNLTEPEEGHWIVIQPWEFGVLPTHWVNVFSSKVDEMWVPTNYVKEVYVNSGIPEERVFVVPNGIDPKKFNPLAKAYKLKTKKKFKFLFVGGTIYRKGIDVLIEAYTKNFTTADDVCLVIKDMGGNSFYKNQTIGERIKSISENKNAPEIEYINSFLTESEMAGLYTACNVLVHPYRGEGFGLPILESMACGTPAIVTDGGACRDFCNKDNSFLVKAEKVFFDQMKIDQWQTPDYPWLFKVDEESLVEKMKFAVRNPDILTNVGKKASNDVLMNWTWQKSFEKVEERSKAIVNKPVKRYEKTEFEKIFSDSITYLNNSDYVKALEGFESALNVLDDTKPNNLNISYHDLLILAGNSSLILNEREKAKQYFEKALENKPDSSAACSGLGEIFYASEQFGAAKTMFEWAVKNEPENPKALLRLADINRELGFPEGHNSLVEYVVDKKDPEELVALAFKLFEEKNFKEAIVTLEKAEALFNGHLSGEKDKEFAASFFTLKGFNHLGLNQLEESKKLFEKALHFCPDSSQACAGLGEVFYLNGMDQESKIMYEWAVKNNSENNFAINGLRKINSVLGMEPNHNSLLQISE